MQVSVAATSEDALRELLNKAGMAIGIGRFRREKAAK
jgi:hypothetical protein